MKAAIFSNAVNGVTVGQISYADYLEIRKAVFSDVRIYVAQLFNLGKVVFLVVNRLIIFTTIVFCCLLIALLFIAPETFTEVVVAIQKIKSTQSIAAITTPLKLSFITSLLVVGFDFVIGSRFGFINCFDQSINDRISRAIGCAVDRDDFLRLSMPTVEQVQGVEVRQ